MITSAMNFPVWELNGINGGLVIAIIAVIHVFVAQFAVGGGFFLVMAERKGHKEKSGRILNWVHRHARFFLLLTLVFGSLTGVGIWLSISLVAPGGTSLLIREFVYAWATEWIFFLGEIVTLLLYVASFTRAREGRMPARDHMLLGWWYAIFAFLSLFVIAGIISFMLTPGEWVNNGRFWSAFFNPTLLPSVVFRFGFALVLAGSFGLITAISIRDTETRESMVRFCAQWICLPFIVMVLGAIWYVAAMPEDVQQALHRKTSDIKPYVRAFLDAAPVLFLAGMFLFIRLPHKAYKPYVIVVLLLGLTVGGAFEWIRETARRPWLVHGYMYSNGITLADGKEMNEKGVFVTSGWSRLRTLGTTDALVQNKQKAQSEEQTAGGGHAVTVSVLTGEQRAKFGFFLYSQQCSNCHGLGSPMLDIKTRVADRGVQGTKALLEAQGVISPYMPPFFGTEEELLVLAQWLADL